MINTNFYEEYCMARDALLDIHLLGICYAYGCVEDLRDKIRLIDERAKLALDSLNKIVDNKII